MCFGHDIFQRIYTYKLGLFNSLTCLFDFDVVNSNYLVLGRQNDDLQRFRLFKGLICLKVSRPTLFPF